MSRMFDSKYRYSVDETTPRRVYIADGGPKDEFHSKKSLTCQAKALMIVLPCLIAALVVATLVVLYFVLPSHARWMPEYNSRSPLGKYLTMAVATSAGTPCAAIGRDILEKREGSAVDAAIAVLICMGAVNPESSGLGGGFLMMVYNSSEKASYYINAREIAPAKAHADMFQGNESLAHHGGLSIAVPGELAGYSLAHKRFGVLPWKDLFAPTIRICEEGIKVNPNLARALQKYKKRIHKSKNMRKVFVNNRTDEVYQLGDVYKRKDLARTLKFIAKHNMRSIYYGNGSLAKSFFKDLKRAKSIIHKSDLKNYKAKFGPPVTKSLRGGMTLYSTNLPGDGVLLSFMLGVLDGYYPDLNQDTTRTRDATVLALHRMIETFKFAYARRMDLEDDDSTEMRKIVDELSSKEYADKIRKRIDDRQTHDIGYYGVNITFEEDGSNQTEQLDGSAHVTIVARNGDAVSVTSTLNSEFGSMVMSPSTGILLNNEMANFFSSGVSPADKNLVSPGRSPLSAMSPAIVTEDGRVRMAVGGSGGPFIATALAQVIIRNLWLGDNIKQAIDAPRFHHQLIPNYIQHEPIFPQTLLDDLHEKDHKLQRLDDDVPGTITGIVRGDDGYLYANSDIRKGGDIYGF